MMRGCICIYKVVMCNMHTSRECKDSVYPMSLDSNFPSLELHKTFCTSTTVSRILRSHANNFNQGNYI